MRCGIRALPVFSVLFLSFLGTDMCTHPACTPLGTPLTYTRHRHACVMRSVRCAGKAAPAMSFRESHARISDSAKDAVRFVVIYDAYLLKRVSLSSTTNCGKDFYRITLEADRNWLHGYSVLPMRSRQEGSGAWGNVHAETLR